MPVISSLLISIGANLITPAFQPMIDAITDPLQKRIVKSKLDALSTGAFVNMEAYFQNEISGKDSQNKIERLIAAVNSTLTVVISNPKKLFSSSLDATKFVEKEISENGYPQEILEDGTTTPYLHFLSTCTNLLLEMPTLLREWELDAWSASFDKLDFLTRSLQEQTATVLKISEDVSSLSERKISTDKAMVSLKSALRQAKARTNVEMRGLSRAQAAPLQLQSIFVSPEIRIPDVKGGRTQNALTTDDEIVRFLTHSGKTHRIIGPAGSGKTTLMRWLEQWHWQSSQKIAVRCDLRVVSKAKELPSTLELFSSCVPTELRGTLTQKEFADWIDNGKTLIIFDGFDEVSITKRDIVEEWIKTCIHSVDHRNSFIVSSRHLTTNHMDDSKWGDQPALYVQGFDKARVRDYIQKWQEHMLSPAEKEGLSDAEQPEKLARTFTSAATIQELTSNPLLLSTLMVVHRFEGKKLPDGRSDLYRIYVDGMLGQWYEKATSNEGVRLTSSQMRRFLRIIAVKMQAEDITSVDETVAAKWLNDNNNTKYLGKRILEHMLERTGLLIGPGEYQFAHKSIGEFLVAEAVIAEQFRVKNGALVDRLYLLKHSNEDSWRVVLFLWAGLVQTLADLLDFSNNLIEKGQVSTALGLIEDRLDSLLEDYSDELEKLVISAMQVPGGKCAKADMMRGSARFVGYANLPVDVPGRYDVISDGHLEISGIQHFRASLFSRCLSSGLLKPESFKGQNLDSGYYFELWTHWIKQGLACNTLIDLRPSNLTPESAIIGIIQHRGLPLTEIAPAKGSKIFFIPFIVNEIFDTVTNGFYSTWLAKNITSVNKYLKETPMRNWDDYWFLLDLNDDPHVRSDRSDWDLTIGFPAEKEVETIRNMERKSFLTLLKQYRRERVERFANAISSGSWKVDDNGKLHPITKEAMKKPSFEGIYGQGSLQSTIKLIDKEISKNGSLFET